MWKDNEMMRSCKQELDQGTVEMNQTINKETEFKKADWPSLQLHDPEETKCNNLKINIKSPQEIIHSN